jgi:hypothetical protein
LVTRTLGHVVAAAFSDLSGSNAARPDTDIEIARPDELGVSGAFLRGFGGDLVAPRGIGLGLDALAWVRVNHHVIAVDERPVVGKRTCELVDAALGRDEPDVVAAVVELDWADILVADAECIGELVLAALAFLLLLLLAAPTLLKGRRRAVGKAG